jgi:hypothetical protein
MTQPGHDSDIADRTARERSENEGMRAYPAAGIPVGVAAVPSSLTDPVTLTAERRFRFTMLSGVLVLAAMLVAVYVNLGFAPIWAAHTVVR